MDNDKIIIDALIKSNKFLREERDSARRKFCEWAVQPGTYFYANKENVAKDHGWDCYDPPEKKDLYIKSPCGDHYKWNFTTRNWDRL